jgi:hypothetical protein
MNCKSGIAAYIKRANADFVDCIGRVVNVVTLTEGTIWQIEFVGEIPASLREWRGDFGIDDAHLVPITGLPVDEEQHDEVTA